MIMIDGSVESLTPHNEDEIVDAWELTNGVAGMNSISRHIVYVGGCDMDMNPKDTRTVEQKAELFHYVKRMVELHPDILIAGHNQFANKACPSFNVPKWLSEVGIPEKNIYKP